MSSCDSFKKRSRFLKRLEAYGQQARLHIEEQELVERRESCDAQVVRASM